MKKSILNQLSIDKYIKKFDKFWYGCDYLRCNYKNSVEFVENYSFLLDTDNSNFATIDIWDISFTIIKWYTPNWLRLDFSCSFNDVVVPCFQFVKFNESSSYIFKSYWKLDFYGSMFRLLDIWFFEPRIFKDVIDLFGSENPNITRFDFKIDFFKYFEDVEIPRVKWFFHYLHSKSKFIEYYEDWWDVLTDWTLWKSPDKEDNWRYNIRYYNKLIDTNKKNKCFLYQDYFNYKSVHRLEIEFLRNFLKWYKFTDFYEWYIHYKIIWVLWINKSLYSWNLFYQYDRDYRITDKNKITYLKKFSSSVVRLSKNWINPLIESYKSMFKDLEESVLQKQVFDFLDFIGSDRQQYRLLYERKKKLFLDLHKIN